MIVPVLVVCLLIVVVSLCCTMVSTCCDMCMHDFVPGQ